MEVIHSNTSIHRTWKQQNSRWKCSWTCIIGMHLLYTDTYSSFSLMSNPFFFHSQAFSQIVETNVYPRNTTNLISAKVKWYASTDAWQNISLYKRCSERKWSKTQRLCPTWGPAEEGSPALCKHRSDSSPQALTILHTSHSDLIFYFSLFLFHLLYHTPNRLC